MLFAGGLGWDIFCTFSVLFLFIGFESYINAIIIIGSLICGFIISIYYNSFFNYVNECGKRDKSTKIYIGIALCINQSANITGNGLSSLLIRPLGQKVYSLLMLSLSFFSSVCFLLIKSFRSNEDKLLALP